MWSGELFEEHPIFEVLKDDLPAFSSFKDAWVKKVAEVLKMATLVMPSPELWMQTGGRYGVHSSQLGYILGEMQSLARTYPDATW
jgi:ring-1,2-phenylacetyl-CoA epoxidase subunit PaaC